MVIFAFGGVISFFQVDSALADEKDINWLFITLGVIGILAAAFCLKKVSNAGSSNDSGI